MKKILQILQNKNFRFGTLPIFTFLLMFSGYVGFGQKTLAVGDISIVGYNLNAPDNFAFVPWVDIADNTYIKFTDNGFLAASSANNTNNGRGGENFVIWRNNTGANIIAGTVITIQDNTTNSITNVGIIVSGNLSGLSASGDNIFAYQGAATTGTNPDWSTNLNPTTFNGTILFGLYTQGSSAITNWLTTGTASSNSSYLPTQLNVLNGNIALASSASRGQYTGLRNDQASLTNYRALVNNPSNWTTGSGAGIITLNTIPFTISASTPTITTIGTLSSVNTIYGTASATPTSFTASGSNLTNDILITPPTGYEVSVTTGGASGYAATQTLTQSSGSVASTIIYIRLKADATVAGSPYSGNIVLSSTGATSVNTATVLSTVSTKTLTITGLTANNKVYDANTTASLSGTPAYSGLENSENFSVTGTVIASFATASVGNTKPISVTDFTAPSTNYTLTQPSFTANITAANLTISGATANNKVYDANNSATITGTLAGMIGSETVTLNPSATFSQTGIGTALTVTSTSTISGVDAGNYSLTQPTGLTADITAKPLTIIGLNANNKVFDGNTTATLSGTATLNGVVSGEEFTVTLTGTPTATFAQSTVGIGIAIIVTGYSLTGSNSGNYTVSQPSGLTADITNSPSPVINSSLTASATYGVVATSYFITATNSPTSFNATGLPIGLTINTATGEISGTPTDIAGSPFSVSISATNNGGTGTATLTYTINPKALTIISPSVTNKVYDKTNAAIISGTLSGIVGSDVVILNGTGTFSQATVGNGLTVISTSTLGGADATKYSLIQPTGLTGEIVVKPLTVSGASVSPKTYDGTNTATLVGATLNGIVSLDDVTLTGGAIFSSVNVGNNIGINTSSLVLAGADAGNYITLSIVGLTGNITTKPLTITGLTVNGKVFDGTTTATISGTAVLNGVISGEESNVVLGGTPVANFNNRNVGTAKPIIIAGYSISGSQSGNYHVTQPADLSANLTALALTLTSPIAQNKVFDGNTNAIITGTLTGVISPDVVNLIGTGTFASSAAGNGIAVTSTSTLGGANAGNYTLTQPTGLTANITSLQFAVGNITVLVAAASTTNTTANIIELNPNNSNQTGVLFPIPSSGANILRFSGSASSTGYLANSNDGSLLLFNGANSTNTTSNANALNPRGIGTFNSTGTFNLPTTYTAGSGNQTRSSTSLDNATFFIADQGGIYTNGSTTASPSGNFRGIKSFGGTVYVSQSSSTATAIQVNTVSATTGGTITGLPGLSNNSTLQDFYLISSGTNGASFDILYILSGSSATVGTIAKYSLVSGSWVANGTHTTAFGGFGLASKKAGIGAVLFVSTGTGATTANNVIKLTDDADYNATINITTANNLVLYTASTGTIAKGVAFSPISVPTSVSLSVSSNTGTEAATTVITVTATVSVPVVGNQTISLGVTGTNITAGDYTLSNTTITIPDGSTTGSVTFTVVDDMIAENTETAILTLSNPSSGMILGSPITQNITIIDNDNTPPTIIIDVATTSNYVDGGSVTSPASSFAVSGVLNDPTDPAKNLGIDFTIGDAETGVGSLTVTTTSSNLTALPSANLNLTGMGASRNLKITPNAEGFSTITVSVNDGITTSTFTINYAASNASINTSTTRFHTGTSDASTAQMIDSNLMLVGDDENQALRLYDRNNSGLPISSFDFTSSLGLTDISGDNPREVDIEASAKVGNRIYWMGSHSNSASGNSRLNRLRFFATDISGTGNSTTLSYMGRYDNLKTELLAWDANNGHGLGVDFLGLAASSVAGKAPEVADGSGFNIEGFEIAPNNTTAYICFRAPLQTTTTRTKALIIPLINFADLVSGNPTATTATFGTPIQLDLGGRAIREMKKNASGEYLIIAGPNDGSTGIAPKDFRFYTWTGNPSDAPILRSADLTALNSGGSFESIVDLPSPLLSTSNLQVLVDNGDAVFYGNGVIAKELPQNNHKKFRSEFVYLGTEILPLITIKSITTGNWESTSTWDLGRIPQAGDLVIIDQSHEITLNGNGNVKKIEYQGTGKLIFSSTSSTLNTGL